MAPSDDLESHLADRLNEQRDVMAFSRPVEQTVSREVTLEGAEHLGGRKVQDTFTRGGGRPQPKPQAELSPRKGKLEHHLEARLKEVKDEMVQDPADALMRAYQERRRKLGGTGA